MNVNRREKLKADFSYLANLVRAAKDGVESAHDSWQISMPAVSIVPSICGGAIAGATLGAIANRWSGKTDRPSRSVALNCLIGSALGLGAILAWSSRTYARCAAGNVARRVNAVRDARWLERHPIEYA